MRPAYQVSQELEHTQYLLERNVFVKRLYEHNNPYACEKILINWNHRILSLIHRMETLRVELMLSRKDLPTVQKSL